MQDRERLGVEVLKEALGVVDAGQVFVRSPGVTVRPLADQQNPFHLLSPIRSRCLGSRFGWRLCGCSRSASREYHGKGGHGNSSGGHEGTAPYFHEKKDKSEKV